MARVRRRRPTTGEARASTNGPAPSSVTLDAPLVGDVAAFLRRYVVMPEDQLLVVALWVIHTHCIAEFGQTPYLSVTSPEKQCGKSRLLEALEMLVARPWMAVLPSEAVVFRNINTKVPTLLLDEIDTIFNPRSADKYEGLRAILNAGHRRGATVPRCIGSTNKMVEFNVFCAKVICGIGTLPDTVADRSIPIRLERKKRDEVVERFRWREVKPPATALRDRIQAWAKDHAGRVGAARPTMPEELSDRMQEGCECLVAIADEIGCGQVARNALVQLMTGERLDSQESMRLRLLRDLKTIFDKRPSARGAFTDSLLTELQRIEEAPWATYYGRLFEARDLAALLKHYDIRSKTIRNRDKVAKGYTRDDLHEAWERYL